jgi:hypothetical protein
MLSQMKESEYDGGETMLARFQRSHLFCALVGAEMILFEPMWSVRECIRG